MIFDRTVSVQAGFFVFGGVMSTAAILKLLLALSATIGIWTLQSPRVVYHCAPQPVYLSKN